MDNTVLSRPGFDLEPRTRMLLAVIFYLLAAIFAYLCFQTITNILGGEKLITSRVDIILHAVAIPLALFSASIFCLTFALVAWQNLICASFFAISFVIDGPWNIVTVSGGVIVVLAVYAYSRLLFKNMDALKHPRITSASQNSFRIFLMLLSVALAMSFYPIYAGRAERVGTAFTLDILQKFHVISAAISDVNDGDTETFRSHTEHYLRAHNLPVTETAIQNREKAVSLRLGVTAKSEDTYQSIINRSLNRRAKVTLGAYQSLLVVAVPLGFFFLISTFTSVAGFVIYGVIFTVEMGLLKLKVLKLVPQISEKAKG